MARVAVVTGADTGLAFGIVKGMLERFDGDVYLTSRDEDTGKAAVAKLNELGLTPEYHQLDVTDRDSVLRFRDHIKEKYNGVFLVFLVINTAAGIKSVELNDSTQERLLPSIIFIIENILNMYWVHLINLRLTMEEDSQMEDINDFMSLFMEGLAGGNFKDDEGTRPVDRTRNITMKVLLPSFNFHSLRIKMVYED